MSGPDPQDRNDRSFAGLGGLSGSTWLLQEVDRIGAVQ